MNNSRVYLNDMLPGQRARVLNIASGGLIRRRLLDLGLISGTTVECLGTSPMGDPKAYLIRGAVIATRAKDSRRVRILPESAKGDALPGKG